MAEGAPGSRMECRWAAGPPRCASFGQREQLQRQCVSRQRRLCSQTILAGGHRSISCSTDDLAGGTGRTGGARSEGAGATFSGPGARRLSWPETRGTGVLGEAGCAVGDVTADGGRGPATVFVAVATKVVTEAVPAAVDTGLRGRPIAAASVPPRWCPCRSPPGQQERLHAGEGTRGSCWCGGGGRRERETP